MHNQTKKTIADEWKNTHQALGEIEKEVGVEKQLVVRHVRAHVKGERRKQMGEEV